MTATSKQPSPWPSSSLFRNVSSPYSNSPSSPHLVLLPGVIIDPKTKTVTKDEKKRVRLLQNGVKPIFPFTFTSVLDKYIILDATAFELQCKSTTFTHILLDDQLLIIKNGAETLPFAVLAETAKLSKQLMTELFYRGLAEILADDAAVQLKVLTASV